jgi:antitoxin (DNA-binding transcriptional repressor) of toxin-antitoxin stability system
MDAVEAGTSFIVTRDSRPMGQLIPLRRRFVTRAQFAESSRYAANPDLKQFRDDAADYLTADMDDPYDR